MIRAMYIGLMILLMGCGSTPNVSTALSAPLDLQVKNANGNFTIEWKHESINNFYVSWQKLDSSSWSEEIVATGSSIDINPADHASLGAGSYLFRIRAWQGPHFSEYVVSDYYTASRVGVVIPDK